MKWVTHQTGAILGAFALNMPWAAAIAVLPGAILPDLVDQKLARQAKNKRRRQKVFNQLHRGASHWFGWWLGLLLVILASPLPSLAQDVLAGFALGAFSHILMDMLTPRGVPLLPFQRKPNIAAPICSTGTKGEYVFLACLLGVGLIMLGWRFRNLFS